MRVLFVCTGNVCRSRVAEEVFRVLTWAAPGRAGHEVRSAGTEPAEGGRPVCEADLEWADVVCVMESAHRSYIAGRWGWIVPKVRVLGVPDIYRAEDSVLRDLLTKHVRALLEEAGGGHTESAPPPAPPAVSRGQHG